jgi:hypothetical protein
MDFLKNLTLDDKEKHDTHSGEHPQPPSSTEQHEGGGESIGKISGALGGDHHNTHTPPPPSAPAKHEGLLDKISGAIDGEHHTPPAPKHEGLLDKTGSTPSGDHHVEYTTELAKEYKEDGLLGKINGALGGEHDSQEPPKEHGLGSKINNSLGGGTAGEKKEGKFKFDSLRWVSY